MIMDGTPAKTHVLGESTLLKPQGGWSLKVTHVVLSLDFGGLERIVLDLARVGRELGQEVSVICLERLGTLAEQVRAEGAEVLCLDKAPGRSPETVDRVRGALRALRPDVVHTHQIGALYYTGPAARRESVPLVVHTEHINHVRKREKMVDRLRMRVLWGLAGRHAARFFCVSEDIAAEVSAHHVVSRRKVHVVDNGIDTLAFGRRDQALEVRGNLGIPPTVKVIGTVGRLAEVKRQDLLLRSFARLGPQQANAHLLLVGDGPLMGALQALAESLGIADRVHFAGYQAHPERLLQAMDVFALTSRLEGMPLAVLEAWAAGLPVIASRVGGLPKMIDHGVNGLLFDSGDEFALAKGLGQLMAHDELARRIGEAGRAVAVARYDVRVTAGRYESHYRDLLAGKVRIA